MRSEWYTMIDDERGTLKLEFNRRMAFLHVMFRLPMEGMRAAKAMFPEVKNILRAIGYKRVHVIIPTGDEKLYRFERLFGFSEIHRDSQLILMGQDC